jgi:hypothetical protein
MRLPSTLKTLVKYGLPLIIIGIDERKINISRDEKKGEN